MGIFDFLKKKGDDFSILAPKSMPQTVPSPTIAAIPEQARSQSIQYKVGDVINVGNVSQLRFHVSDVKTGGMGIVYIAVQESTSIPYAIKTFQDWCFNVPNAIERFTREAETWIRLEKHPNIVRAQFLFKLHKRPHIFLEYVSGIDLRSELSSGSLSLERGIKYAIQFCRGMAHAQTKISGFVHRDIKPENCLISEDGILKVTDFGLVKTFADLSGAVGFTGSSRSNRTSTQVFRTQAGQVGAGTPHYMSPEQFGNFAHTDIRSDIYSFGVMFFEMLTGRRPFEANSLEEWYYHHQNTLPPNPASINSKVPRVIAELILSCMEKSSSKRPHDFNIIEAKLSSFLRTEYQSSVQLPPTEELSVAELSSHATSLYFLGRNNEAIEYFNRVLAIDPRNQSAWSLKGATLAKLARHSEALECFNHALAIDSNDYLAWINKSTVLSRMNKHQEALESDNRALAINPKFAGGWNNKADTLAKIGDYTEAVKCIDRALALDPTFAQAWANKGNYLYNLQQFDKALECYNRALEVDPQDDEMELINPDETWVNNGQLLARKEKYIEALACFKQAVAINPQNVQAICKMADIYAGGYGVPQDYTQAASWYLKAAELGIDEAQCELATIYHDGLGVKQDFTQALTWYRKAAEQGNEIAQYNLGLMHHFGEGTPKNSAQSRAWYHKAAEQGYIEAQRVLGQIYLNGIGVPEDAAQAAIWYHKAAEQGDAESQSQLGFMYFSGEGVPSDKTQAFEWCRRAADQGNMEGQRALAVMYRLGQGVPHDNINAYMWSLLALENGDERTAPDYIAELELEMPPQQITEAKRRAKTWKINH